MKTKIYENYIKNGRSDADKDELIKVPSLSRDTIKKKALDRVWNEGLLYKLRSYGIRGPLLILIKVF